MAQVATKKAATKRQSKTVKATRQALQVVPQISPKKVLEVLTGNGKPSVDNPPAPKQENWGRYLDPLDSKWKAFSEAKITDFIKNYYGSIVTEVTPTIARFLLDRNKSNRRKSSYRVEEMSQRIKAGKFKNTGENIIMSDNGILNTGQHRLLAVLFAGKTVELDIRYGIPRSRFANTDTGAKKLAADVLSVEGFYNPAAIAAAVRMLLAYRAGLPSSNREKFSNEEILEAANEWGDDLTRAAQIAAVYLPHRGFINSATISFTFLALRQTDEATVNKFLEVFGSGLTNSKNHPARLLRERFNDQNLRQKGTRAASVERLALCIKAWNAWRSNTPIQTVRWRIGGPSPEKFPVMEGVNL